MMCSPAGSGGYNAAPAQSTYGAPASGGRYNAAGQNSYSSNTGGGYGGPAGF